MKRALLTFGALVALAGPALAANEIETLDGTHQERVLSIQGTGAKLVVKTADRSIPLDTVKSIRLGRPGRVKAGQTKVVLGNGDWLRGALEAGNEDQIGFKSQALGSLKISLETVRAVVIGAASLEQERSLEQRLLEKSEVDWVLLDNGGVVRGSIVKVDGAQVTIDSDTDGGSNMGTLPFDLVKVRMISIAPLDEPKKPDSALRTSVGLTDGSRLRGKPISLDGAKFVLAHALGKGGKLGISRQRISHISVENGRFTYLSDVRPGEVEQRFPPEYTYEVRVWGWKRDTNVTGGPLRLEGVTYAKGLGMHSYCKLTYRLGGAYKRFKSVVGLDDGVKYLGEPGFGGVVFRVLVDGKPAPELSSGLRIRKGEKPKAISVNLSGKQTLTLIADFDPTSLHVLGRADWADAHLIKK
jgi:hypothetical protein